MKVYLYYRNKSITGGMSERVDYSFDPQVYGSLDKLLSDHPGAKKDDLWVDGEVYQETEVV